MEYLNRKVLQGLSPQEFHRTKPYPWSEIRDSLTAEGFERLRASLPPVEAFERRVGVRHADGQLPHNRYLLHFRPGVTVPEPWMEFIAELQGPVYLAFLRRMLGDHTFIPTFEWNYTWSGCGLPPRCDAPRKLATHIFYFNTAEEWKPEWGGNLLILDDEQRLKREAIPGFDDLRVAASVEPLGNGSLLYERTPHAWHGLRPLQSPADTLQRLFVVTVNIPTLQVWWRGLHGKDPDGFRLTAA